MQPMKQPNVPEGRALRPLPAELSYMAILDIRNVETEITDFMVRRACEEMDRQQTYPFLGRKHKMRRVRG